MYVLHCRQQDTSLSWWLPAPIACSALYAGQARKPSTSRIASQAAVCIGFTAAIIWRMRSASATGAARDEELALLGGDAGARGPAQLGSSRSGPLLHCAALTLVGGMAAGLVGLVPAHPLT